jgi:hypothetical protein
MGQIADALPDMVRQVEATGAGGAFFQASPCGEYNLHLLNE